MKKFIALLLVAFALIAFGCVQQQAAPTATPTATPSPTVALATPTATPLPTTAPTATAVPTATPLPAGTVYYEDFESGKMPDWGFDDPGAWALERAEDHGFILAGGSSVVNKYAGFGSSSWTDYNVNFKMRLYGGIIRIGLRNSTAGAYFVGITPNTFILYKQVGNSTPGVIAQTSVPQVWGTKITNAWVDAWMQVRGGPKNTSISVWIDNNPMIQWTDPSDALLNGNVVFVLIDGTRVGIDNVNVTTVME